jgi:F-type H+-transporting ATPase subunit delta
MSRPTTAPRRYAEAAFELATRDGTLDEWRTGLADAARLVADEQVARIVANPARPVADRLAVIDRLLNGRVSDPVRHLVRLLTQRGRIESLPAVAAEYSRRLNRSRGIVEAVAVSATPLTADETAALRRKVEAMTGATVELRTEVDPALIGGLTVRVGDQLLDASVRGRLERLRDKLVMGTR